MKKLLIVCGAEGVGKSTLAKKILIHLNNGAVFDAENLAQVSPFIFDDSFCNLVIDNSLDLINNFYEYGYERVVGVSFLNHLSWFNVFKSKLKYNPEIYILMLTTAKPERDYRRLNREKKTTRYWMDLIDKKVPMDTSLKDSEKIGGYTYIEIDNTAISVEDSIAKIKKLIPDFFS